ncbi:MAG: VTT domain-containing protein [Eubacteriales bacterium]
MRNLTKKQLTEVLLIALRITVAAALFSIALMNYERLTHLDIRSIVSAASSIAVAIAAVLGIYLIKSVLFVVPASIIYIYVGMAFNTSEALIINLAGIIIEVTLTFWLGRFLGGAYVEKKIRGQKWGDKLLNIKQKNTLSFLFVVRLLPAFPIDFISLFLGASGIGFLPYFLISVFGIMPRVILFTILGDGIYDYIPMELLVFFAIFSIPVALIISLVIHFNKKRNTVVNE